MHPTKSTISNPSISYVSPLLTLAVASSIYVTLYPLSIATTAINRQQYSALKPVIITSST